MRKFIVFLLSFAILMMSANYSFSASTTAFSGTTATSNLKDVKCVAKNNQVQVSISIDNYKGYKTMYISKPDRLVIDIPNSMAPKNQQVIKVDSKLVKSVRYAQYSDNITRVVIDTVGQPKFQTVEKSGQLLLYILNPILPGIGYYADESGASLVISGFKMLQSGGKKLYTEKYELSGKKYTITFDSSLLKLESKIVTINDDYISTLQVVKNTTTKKTSIVFRAKDKFAYSTSLKTDVSGSLIKISKTGEPSRGGDEERPQLPSLQGVSYSGENGVEQVIVSAPSFNGYNIMRVTGPERIVLDIPNTLTEKDQKTINVNSTLIKSIRYAQFDDTTARVVIDTSFQAQYDVQMKDGQLIVTVERPPFSKVTYKNSFDRVYLLLDDVVLTEGTNSLKKLYTGSYDATGLQYTMTFPASQANIGNGTLKINDSLLDSIQIVDGEDGKSKSIIFNAKAKLVYETVTRDMTGDTAINVLKPYAKEDRLVVIDPGHGGVEPGATSGDLKEKDVNLDIALRLNALLKSKGIKTYMTRQDDSYVGLYERAYIANDLNAELFLCIHNNAFNSSEHGTETLYYPNRANENGFSSQSFAQIIQDSLISTLGTFNRKIVSRPNLVVLRETKMPAALAEVAFLTNPSEKKKLMDDDFKQKAAEALCQAVLKSLDGNKPKN